MIIETIPNDSIYTAPIVLEDSPLQRTSLCIQGIRITNNDQENYQITSIAIQLKTKNRIAWQFVYDGEFLEHTIKQFKNYGPQKFEDPNITPIFFGRATFWDFDQLQSSPILENKQEVGFEMDTFEYRGDDVPELLQIEVKCQSLGDKSSKTVIIKTLPIFTNKSKNTYLLPLKGAWNYNRSYDWEFGHRHSYAQEFAFDFQQYNAQFRIQNEPKLPNSAFPHYSAKVYAAAEGTVTIVEDGFPENERSEEIIMMDPDKQKKFIQEFGFHRTLMGNHIMIQHPNEEYSVYCHMIPGKMCVKVGERVKAGQQIGQLGNSGFSGFPHLHFHLVDGPHPINSRGLPCRFRNITDEYAHKIEFLQINNQYVHTDLHEDEYI